MHAWRPAGPSALGQRVAMGGEVHVVSTARASASRRFRGRHGLVSALILIAGVLAGTAGIAAGTSGTGTAHISADLGYQCRFPSGTHPVTVLVSGALPATATPGERIQPTSLRITAGLPRTAIEDLTRLGATSVTATGSLTTVQTSAGKSATAQWPAKATSSYRLPATGGLQLAQAAMAPPAAAARPGTVTFAASDLVINLTPSKADGSATSP